MPQGRIILKTICQSKKLASLKTDGARLLYTWLIPNLDISGCFSGDVDVVKGQVFTRLKKSDENVESYLKDLCDTGLIVLYPSSGDMFLCVPDFAEKQPSLNPSKEAKSTIPPPTPEQLQSKVKPTPPEVKGSKVKLKESKEEKNIPHVEFLEYWNKTRLPKIQVFTGYRRKQLNVRSSEPVFLTRWVEIIDKLVASDFCNGINDQKWRAKVDWILKNDTNYMKVLEGNYDNKPKDKTPLEKLAEFEEQERKRKGAV